VMLLAARTRSSARLAGIWRAWASELATSENSVKCSRDSFDTLLCFQEIRASDRASDFA